MVKLGCWSCHAHIGDTDGAPAVFACPHCGRDNFFSSRVMVDCPSCRRPVSIDLLEQEWATCIRCRLTARVSRVNIHTIDPITPFTTCDDGLLSDHNALQCRQKDWRVDYWPRPDGPYDDVGALHEHADAVLSRNARLKTHNVLAILPCAFRADPVLVGWSNVVFSPRDSGTAKFMGAGGSAKFQTDFEGILGALRISVIAVTRAVAALLAQHPFYARFESMFDVVEPRSSQLSLAHVPVVLQGVTRHAAGIVWRTPNGETWRVTRVNSDGTAELVALGPRDTRSGAVLSAVSEVDLLRAGLMQE